ncbi:histidine phosphatase family protein [Umezawaea beigongshangensis]|uniref:histidine phosphatase family protein n=1 Tax=Umezawaea beigongshangensis TaxID=2780383 RepID=UPI0018F271D5|nr:histidine phosphatase family protein [Umezawaea beigongshangensis]
MRLLLVRHGQTASNRRHALDSLPPGPPLTEEGREQALALAADLADEPVVAVYASTAVRAQETAAPVAAHHGLQVEVVEGVHEVFCGDLEGRADQEAFEAFVAVFSAWADGDLSVPVPGGEAGQDVVDRFAPVVRAIRDRHQEGTAVLVTHGAAMRLAALSLAGDVRPTLAESALIPNTGRIALEATPDGWHCLSWTGLDLDAARGPRPVG